jgi:uncharacterized membrane protein YqjE
MHSKADNGRSLGAILTEMKEEVNEFARTRLEMFQAEFREKIKSLKVVVPLAAVAVLLLGTAYLLFTMAVVGLMVAVFQNNPYRWFFAFAAVAALWTLLGGIAGYFAKREFESNGLVPKRTIELLKGDKLWIQAEAKNQI